MFSSSDHAAAEERKRKREAEKLLEKKKEGDAVNTGKNVLAGVSPSSGSNQGANQASLFCAQPQMFWSHDEFKAITSMGNTTLAALATALQLDATGTKAQLLERIVTSLALQIRNF